MYDNTKIIINKYFDLLIFIKFVDYGTTIKMLRWMPSRGPIIFTVSWATPDGKTPGPIFSALNNHRFIWTQEKVRSARKMWFSFRFCTSDIVEKVDSVNGQEPHTDTHTHTGTSYTYRDASRCMCTHMPSW